MANEALRGGRLKSCGGWPMGVVSAFRRHIWTTASLVTPECRWSRWSVDREPILAAGPADLLVAGPGEVCSVEQRF